MTPRVSVVMTVYNGEGHLAQAVDSVLVQTLGDLEFIIVDDASTDATPDLLSRYAEGDSRIRVLRNEVNLGPYPSANRALGHATAPLIARMDADDISEPNRLDEQVSFLEANDDHLLVGSGYRSIDDTGSVRFARSNPLGDLSLRWVTRFRMPMMHPSFCFRATLPDGSPVRYGEDPPIAQDYALAAELLGHGRGEVLAPLLIRYRWHGDTISASRRQEQNDMAIDVALGFLEDECGPATAEDFRGLIETLYKRRSPDSSGLDQAVRAFDSLIDRDSDGGDLRTRWMKRRAAGILAEAFLSGGNVGSRVARTLSYGLRHPRYVVPLGMRAMEIKGLIKTLPGP